MEFNLPIIGKVTIGLADKPKEKVIVTENGNLPISGGRSSNADVPYTILDAIMDEVSIIPPEFQVEVIGILEHLAKYNADVSYAVENIVQLGNTAFDVSFNDGLTDKQVDLMRKELNRVENDWYAYSGGLNSLRNDLLAQASVAGAVSGEAVPNDNLDGIKKIVLVSPKNIRFAYNTFTDSYDPYQLVKNGKIGSGIAADKVKLNTTTYKYYAVRRLNENPYAIPPFLAALDSICIEKDMMDNFKHVIKKLGIFGFMQVLVKQPVKVTGMDDDQYKTAAKKYLTDAAAEVEKGLKKGYVVGFEGMHEFKMEQTTTNVQGAKEMYEMNTQMKMAGLKQDPLMLGRNYSTTETVGRVVLAKLSAQLTNYQMLVDKFIGEVMYLHLILKGFKGLSYVKVESKKPLLADEVKEQDAMSKKIANYDNLYKQGVISQLQRSQALGFDNPDQEEPREVVNAEVPTVPTAKDNVPAQEDVTDVTDTKNLSIETFTSDLVELELDLNSDVLQFDYGTDVCGKECSHTMSFADNDRDKDFNRFHKNYAGAINERYKVAVNKVAAQVAKNLAQFGQGADLQQVQDAVLATIYKNWKSEFTDKNRKYINKWVQDSFKFFKNDTSMFMNGADASKLPSVSLNLPDLRTIDYYKKSDSLYLGKFITDDDTKAKITTFIQEEYLNNGLPINNPAVSTAFKEKFGETLIKEDWKIDRIVSTTLSKMRVTAATSYMNDAGVEKFKILAANDRLVCPYCSATNGKEFEVKTYVDKYNSLYATSPEEVRLESPFITSQIKSDKLEGITSDQLTALKYSGLPNHCECRCTVTAVL